MSEEIKKNVEINDDELEQASGGASISYVLSPSDRIDCPECKGEMLGIAFGARRYYRCHSCGHEIERN